MRSRSTSTCLPKASVDGFAHATAVYVRADKETPWDAIAQIVADLGEAKFEVRMVTAPVSISRPGSGVNGMTQHIDILDQRDPLGGPLVALPPGSSQVSSRCCSSAGTG